MRKFFITIIFIFGFYNLYANATYSADYSIGQNIIYADNTIKLPNQNVGISITNPDFPNLFFAFGYNFVFKKSVGNHNGVEDFIRNYGFSSAIGYDIPLYSYNEQVIFITPCLSFNSYDLLKSEYEEFEAYQLGLKTVIGLKRKISKNLEFKFSISPQYNFLNYIVEQQKIVDKVYTYNPNTDTYEETSIYIKDESSSDSEEDSYKIVEYCYPKSSNDFSFFSFQYSFSISFVYRF